MIPMFVLVPVMKEPLSTFATALSLFPPCTPLLMMLRQSTPGGIPAWQPWVGLIGMTLCTALYVWAAGRIFRIGTQHVWLRLAPSVPRHSQSMFNTTFA